MFSKVKIVVVSSANYLYVQIYNDKKDYYIIIKKKKMSFYNTHILLLGNNTQILTILSSNGTIQFFFYNIKFKFKNLGIK